MFSAPLLGADQVGYSWVFKLEVYPLCCFEAFTSFRYEILAQSVKPSSSRAEELKRKGSKTDGGGDSLLLNAELSTGAVSSILKDSDLKRSNALPVEKALTQSL